MKRTNHIVHKMRKGNLGGRHVFIHQLLYMYIYMCRGGRRHCLSSSLPPTKVDLQFLETERLVEQRVVMLTTHVGAVLQLVLLEQ